MNSCKDSSLPYHNFNSNICINNCQGTYLYSKDYICYSRNECNYYQIDENGNYKCLSSCNVGEGFKLISDDNNPKRCFTSCSGTTNQYYSHGSNICMAQCKDFNNGNIYHKYNGYECFSSCKEIEGGIYIFEKDDIVGNGICYNSFDSCSTLYYYEIKDGIKKCVNENDCII